MRTKYVSGVVLTLVMIVCMPAAMGNGGKPMSDKAIIKLATSAAPKSVSEKAAVVLPDQQGDMKTLRKGTNGWTCMLASPTVPGGDAMCVDPNGFEWISAMLKHETPPDKVGFGYMLHGSAGATDNNNPTAPPLANKKDWHPVPPHVMIFGPPVMNMPGYQTGDKINRKAPFVMWKGTPYEHLMIPVK